MTGKTLKFIVAVVALLLLVQYKSTKSYALGIGIIVLVGYTVTHYTTIRQQFSALGQSGSPSGGGGLPPKYSAN